jgi:hypothetical protein
MKNETKIIVALILLIIAIGGVRWVYLARTMPEARIPDVKPVVQEVKISESTTIPIETYVNYPSQSEYADPFRYIRYLFTASYVSNATIFFEASSEGKENQQLVKAVGELSYTLGYKKKNITTRQLDTFRKMLLQAKVLGQVSSPVIYLKTPNLGGKVTRIIVAPGVIILEAANYEDIVTLSQLLGQVVLG